MGAASGTAAGCGPSSCCEPPKSDLHDTVVSEGFTEAIQVDWALLKVALTAASRDPEAPRTPRASKAPWRQDLSEGGEGGHPVGEAAASPWRRACGRGARPMIEERPARSGRCSPEVRHWAAGWRPRRAREEAVAAAVAAEVIRARREERRASHLSAAAACISSTPPRAPAKAAASGGWRGGVAGSGAAPAAEAAAFAPALRAPPSDALAPGRRHGRGAGQLRLACVARRQGV
eukprot:CAMPEP_0180489392 /NCGR_PEP_ID=MMETSP1036_2-20121128/38565_1 /TAXON_ID=632150 /ORGANISM="Azadinium spinosum, Strain 3D9" /LENGTH=232 /DNA_ID=CAMNT_0022497531 /DNA_START=14 /DNA_END=713 /DNA_ORIENTATION=-